MKTAPKMDVAGEGANPEPAKMPAPKNSAKRSSKSELLAPLVEHAEKISDIQSVLNQHQAALAERKNRKETQLAALDDKITNLARKYTGSETDVLIQLKAKARLQMSRARRNYESCFPSVPNSRHPSTPFPRVAGSRFFLTEPD
jgi:hypothetical protein